MADDRNFWGVIGDVAGQAAQDIPRWQQSKLDARHKAHLDALAQRHAQEQYEAQMRGLDIREQQALAQQHAQEARESYNQSRLDQIDRQFGETERRNRATEEIAGLRADKEKAPPNYLGIIPQRAEGIRSANALQRSRESTGMDEYGGRTYREPTTPLISDSTALERAYGENVGQFPQWNVSPDSIRTGVGLPLPPAPQPRGIMARPGGGMGDLRMQDRYQTPQQGGFGPDRSYPTFEAWQEAKAMGIPGA